MSGIGFTLKIIPTTTGPQFKARYFTRLPDGTEVEGYEDEGPGRIVGAIHLFELRESAKKHLERMRADLEGAFADCDYEWSVDVELNLDLFTGWSVRTYGLDVDPDDAVDFSSPAEFNDHIQYSVHTDAYRPTNHGPSG